MAEIGLALLVMGVLLVADPDWLQRAIDKLQAIIAWLGE